MGGSIAEPGHRPGTGPIEGADQAPRRTVRDWRAVAVRWVHRLEAVVMAGGIGACLAGWADAYADSLAGARVFPGVSVAGESVADLDRDAVLARVESLGQAALDRRVVLDGGGREVDVTVRELGARPVPEVVAEQALAVGRSGDVLTDLRVRTRARTHGYDIPMGHRFDESIALTRLMDLAPAVDRPSLPTRLDLEGRRVVPATAGSALLPFDSLSAVAVGLASGAERVELVIQPKSPVRHDPLGRWADMDIQQVLGRFETPYSLDPRYAGRTHNLELGAAAVDGFVLAPGETFSFNEVVGDRSAEAGFRWAPGITAGELVDVLGGGICQISSTLYGAAFFAGLELERARPHSRPSSYVDMGLDSTVVYPDIDMRLRNTFEFPVVFHMVVSQGKVQAEVLGERRPYQVVFERELVGVVPFETVYRDDDRLRAGTERVVQRGLRGFSVQRRRKLMQGGEVVREESRDLHYPPTTRIVARGTSPNGDIPEPKVYPTLRDPAPKLRIVQ